MDARWAARIANHGPSGLSPDGAASIRAAILARADARTHCKRGHLFDHRNTIRVVTPRGTQARQCRRCRNDRRREQRAAARQQAALVRTDLKMPMRSVAWARQKDVHPEGHGWPVETRERAAKKQRQTIAQWTHCKKGLHRWTKANTIVRSSGKRLCRACNDIANGRRTWERRVVAPKLAELRAAMFAAHPDKGGTAARFIKARRAYERARGSDASVVAMPGGTQGATAQWRCRQ